MKYSKWLTLPVVAILTGCGSSDSSSSKKETDTVQVNPTFDEQYLVSNSNVSSGEIIWKNKGVFPSSSFVTDNNGNLYVYQESTDLGNEYSLGTIALNKNGNYRWENEDLTLYANSPVISGRLYSNKNKVDTESGEVLETLDKAPIFVLENGNYITGSMPTTLAGDGLTSLYDSTHNLLWESSYGAPQLLINDMIITSQGTLNISDGSYLSDVAVIYSKSDNKVFKYDPSTGNRTTIFEFLDDDFEYIVSEAGNVLLHYNRDTDILIGYSLTNSNELWNANVSIPTTFNETLKLNPDGTKVYYKTSTADLVSIDVGSGESWTSSSVCNKIVGFSQLDGTIYCQSRYAISTEKATDTYLVAIKP